MANNFKNRFSREKKSDFSEKLIDLRRVARVVAGGRRFNFRATVVVGNRRGEVGLGIGKGHDVSLAMEKASRAAKKNLLRVPLTAEGTIPHETEAKLGPARVRIKPKSGGGGLRAGGAVRVILDLAGVKSASAKILSHTKNKINNARAVLEALRKLKHATPRA